MNGKIATNKKTLLILILACISIVFALLAVPSHNLTLMYIANIIMFTFCILFFWSNYRSNSAILFFFICYFIFLLGTASYYLKINNSAVFISLSIVFVGFVSILAGFALKGTFTISIGSKKKTALNTWNLMYMSILGQISELIFYLSFPFVVLVAFEKIITVRSFGYIGLYTVYTSHLPTIVQKLAVVNTATFFLFIATFPSKRKTYKAIVFYLLALTLDLLTGVRGNFATGVLIIATYTFIRNSIFEVDHIFESKIFKILLPIVIIAIIFILGITSALRQNESGSGSAISFISRFFNEQGGTFGTIVSTIEKQNQVHSMSQDYSFYSLIHCNSFFERIYNFFHQNSYTNTSIDNNLGFTITYLLDPIYYKSGGSFGTTYLGELYTDGKWLSVIIYNIFLGMILRNVADASRRNAITLAYGLMIIKTLYFLPRDSCFSFVTTLISLTNFVTIFGIYFIANYIFRKENMSATDDKGY